MSAPVRGATGQQGSKAPPASQEEKWRKMHFSRNAASRAENRRKIFGFSRGARGEMRPSRPCAPQLRKGMDDYETWRA